MKIFVVLGNVVASEAVITAMQIGFRNAEELPLSERLLRGIEAGRDAGAQLDGQRSAFIKVLGPGEEVPGPNCAWTTPSLSERCAAATTNGLPAARNAEGLFPFTRTTSPIQRHRGRKKPLVR